MTERVLVLWLATMAALFIGADAHLGEFVVERIDVAVRRLVVALEFPGGHMRKVLIVALALAIGILVFLAKVAAAGFLAGECIAAHQFAELDEIGHAAGLFQ